MIDYKAYHTPKGNPCQICGKNAYRHRVEHHFEPHPSVEYCCKICMLPQKNHKIRDKTRNPFKKKQNMHYIGIDGEGQTGPDGNHRYTLLAASTEDGEREWFIQANDFTKDTLSSVQCLDLILELPTRNTKIFSYAFNYDITKMLTDLPNETLYKLFRPELRPNLNPKFPYLGPTPVEWYAPGMTPENDEPYELNLQGTKFTVKRGTKKVVIWDLIKFFQAKFVSALKDWKVGTPELHERMQRMKEKRSDFDKETPLAIRTYCLEETRCMGLLAEKLIKSHEDAGLELKSYYGAGSSGAAMLTAMDIKTKLAPCPPLMREPVAAAFFGGRFENSVIGSIHEALDGWDISSAYVYQLAFLPCLEHGSWTHTKKRSDLSRAECQSGALVRYELGPNPGIGSWGPFPFRSIDGSITFPIESGGGWVWLDEFIAGERIFPHVRFKEAWVYSSNCNCKPFGKIPEYYNLRLKIGKEGPGLVIKLGMNSCYGKLAQSVGNALFQSWIWAGMITSGCRAQILQMMGMHENMSNLLMIATDGIVTREKLKPPKPLPTGTDTPVEVMTKKGTVELISKPLGGWENKPSEKGMFMARPGIYFPFAPTEDEVAQVRARGVGRSVVLEHWESIIEAWERDGVNAVARVPNVSRFCGGKTSISRSGNKEKGYTYKRAGSKQLSMFGEGGNKPSYGQWISRKVEMSFNPLPKRAGVNPDGVTLTLRKFPRTQESVPYDRATMMTEGENAELQAMKEEMAEQPDFDYCDDEVG